jgi:cytidine deaminase
MIDAKAGLALVLPCEICRQFMAGRKHDDQTAMRRRRRAAEQSEEVAPPHGTYPNPGITG